MEASPINKAIPSWGSPTLEGFDLQNAHEGERIRGSSRQFVRFYKKKFVEVVATKVKINEKTGSTQVLETKPVEKEEEFVQIVTPGDKNSIDARVEDFHRREFWPQYKAFRDGKGVPLGTPIEECSFISPSIALELKYLGCHTVEQLADGSDLLSNQIANGWELREYARAVVKAQGNNKDKEQVNLLQVNLEKAQQQIAELAEANKKMQAMILDATGNPIRREEETTPEIVSGVVSVPQEGLRRGPGRPRIIKE